jgi:hypothetical protein
MMSVCKQANNVYRQLFSLRVAPNPFKNGSSPSEEIKVRLLFSGLHIRYIFICDNY